MIADEKTHDALMRLLVDAALLEEPERGDALRSILRTCQALRSRTDTEALLDVKARCLWMLGKHACARRVVEISAVESPTAAVRSPKDLEVGPEMVASLQSMWIACADFLVSAEADKTAMASVRSITISQTVSFLSGMARWLGGTRSAAELDRRCVALALIAQPDTCGLGFDSARRLAGFLLEDENCADLTPRLRKWQRAFDVNIWLRTAVWHQ